jgi:hypothetical protein
MALPPMATVACPSSKSVKRTEADAPAVAIVSSSADAAIEAPSHGQYGHSCAV